MLRLTIVILFSSLIFGQTYKINPFTGQPDMVSVSGGGGGGAVSSVFGRTGAVTAAAGDYTTAQVTESGNLYYTDVRARAAITGTAQTYSAGAKQTFSPSGTTAGLNVGVRASAPSTPAQGDVYFDSTLTRKAVYDGTQWRYELYAPTGTGVMQWNGSVITAGALAYSSLTGTPSFACEVVLGDPGAATPALADDNDAPAICANVSGSTMQITDISCRSDAGSPTVRPILTGGASNSLLTGDLTCGTGSYATGTLNGTPTMSANSTVDANIASAGGVAKYIVIRITRRII